MNDRLSLAAMSLAAALSVQTAVAEPSGREILDAAGVRGGLIVHLGCDDGRLTGELAQGDSFLVQGLDEQSDHVQAARRYLQSQGLYGRASVQSFDGRRLPYVDNLVNLIVVSGVGCQVSEQEVQRVLCPGGTLIRISPDTGNLTPSHFFRKPWPDSIDHWGHFLHGPDNNAVAEDREVGPPRHMQWLAGPLWTRHHHADKGTDPTIRSVVSAQGRLYYMIDEAGTSDMKVPAEWFLVARDGFSGVLLWKKPLPIDGTNRRLERVWRGLIADGGFVYAPLGADQPLAAIEGATGRVVRTYEGTVGLQEVIKSAGSLLVVTAENSLLVLDADSAARQWQWQASPSDDLTPLTLAASGKHVCIKTARGLTCLAAGDGRTLWHVDLPAPEQWVRLRYPHEKLIVKDGVVLCSFGGKDPKSLDRDSWEFLGSHPRVREYDGRLGAFAIEDGRKLWQAPYYPGLESMPGEVYVANGQVWLGPDFASPRDLHTGEALKSNPVLDRLWSTGHHYRCYPGKATCNYILTAKRGIELIDMAGEDHSRNNWIRGTCRVGVTPCNGLIYAPPHSCGCYMEAKLFGFWALRGEAGKSGRVEESQGGKEGELQSEGTTERGSDGVGDGRLVRGPVYSAASNADLPFSASGLQPSSWPTYRGDAARSGSASDNLPSPLAAVWSTRVGGRLSGLTVADGRVFISQVDAHTVLALDAADGLVAWRFTAGGRVDSPPTVHGGLVLFGSADGCIYCLRASDGGLVWQFRAAPANRQAVAYEQLESLWPVHGSVLVRDGVAYAAAGRSSYLDGGIYLYGLDPWTGEVICERKLADEHVGAMAPPPGSSQAASEAKITQNATDYKTFLAADRSDAFSMQGALPDILSADDAGIYMRHLRFGPELVEIPEQRQHLLSTSCLLDDNEHHRSYWALGTGDFSRTPVAFPWIVDKSLAVPYGTLLAFDKANVWGIRRGGSRDYPQGYSVFAQPRPDPDSTTSRLPDFAERDTKPSPPDWATALTMRPRALIRTGDTLCIGGLAAQTSHPPTGEDPGLLLVASSRNGEVKQQVPLDGTPVWDGLAAANGHLYASLVNGAVVCLGKQ